MLFNWKSGLNTKNKTKRCQLAAVVFLVGFQLEISNTQALIKTKKTDDDINDLIGYRECRCHRRPG